jgi:beta-phosphoglucomutase-like phosphatase (HAD superfamily)
VESLQKQGYKTAVASSSENCAAILKAAGNLESLFEVRVDGRTAADLGGKPEPDMFLAAARQLRVEAGQTIVNASDGTLIRLYVDDEPLRRPCW